MVEVRVRVVDRKEKELGLPPSPLPFPLSGEASFVFLFGGNAMSFILLGTWDRFQGFRKKRKSIYMEYINNFD